MLVSLPVIVDLMLCNPTSKIVTHSTIIIALWVTFKGVFSIGFAVGWECHFFSGKKVTKKSTGFRSPLRACSRNRWRVPTTWFNCLAVAYGHGTLVPLSTAVLPNQCRNAPDLLLPQLCVSSEREKRIVQSNTPVMFQRNRLSHIVPLPMEPFTLTRVILAAHVLLTADVLPVPTTSTVPPPKL